MRPRIKYNIEDIKINLFTTGSEWMTVDGTEYKGVYHQYIDGTVLTRGTYDAVLSKELIPYISQKSQTKIEVKYNELKPKLKTKYQSVYSKTTRPTQNDYKTGFFNRYFIEKFDNQIFEIDAIVYDLYKNKKIDTNLYTAVELTWTLTGPIQNETVNGVTTLSIENANRKSVAVAARTCPGLLNTIENYLEFAIVGNIKVPADINK